MNGIKKMNRGALLLLLIAVGVIIAIAVEAAAAQKAKEEIVRLAQTYIERSEPFYVLPKEGRGSAEQAEKQAAAYKEAVKDLFYDGNEGSYIAYTEEKMAEFLRLQAQKQDYLEAFDAAYSRSSTFSVSGNEASIYIWAVLNTPVSQKYENMLYMSIADQNGGVDECGIELRLYRTEDGWRIVDAELFFDTNFYGGYWGVMDRE